MKNIIVNLNNECDLYEKYNNSLSRDLINYLIRESKVKDDIKITINTNLEIDNLEKFIKNGLENAYIENRRIDKVHDIKQLTFLIVGLILLILSTINLYNVIKEVIIIAGWVAIWDVVDISLNVDSELKLTRKLIKKLISCEIEVNKI